MNTQDICKFIPSKSIDKDLLTLNFVYECQFFPEEFLSKNAYSINLVSAGRGILHIRNGEYLLQPGVVFFTFPQQEYRVESTEDLQYMYVSFLGIRANALMERLGLRSNYAVFPDCGALLPTWKQALHVSEPENLDLITEGLLLYSLAHLCNTEKESNAMATSTDIVLKVKLYLEEHFTDHDLTLQAVAAKFGYNHKYLSQKFIKTISIGFNDYLQDLRIQHARKLIREGMQNVAEISRRCGYNDPFYFSRLFREKTGLSPKQYMRKRGE